MQTELYSCGPDGWAGKRQPGASGGQLRLEKDPPPSHFKRN